MPVAAGSGAACKHMEAETVGMRSMQLPARFEKNATTRLPRTADQYG